MIYIFIAATVISAVLFGADMILRYMEKIKSFGAEKTLIKRKGKTIPIERFFPLNLTMVFVYFLIFGTIGIILSYVGLYWYISLPCAIMAGSFGIFTYQYPYELAKKQYLDKAAPLGDTAAGVEGRVLELIPAGDYGLIEFEWNGEIFRVNAMSANDTALREHERVIVILEEEGAYFVESITEVYDILNSGDNDFDI